MSGAFPFSSTETHFPTLFLPGCLLPCGRFLEVRRERRDVRFSLTSHFCIFGSVTIQISPFSPSLS